MTTGLLYCTDIARGLDLLLGDLLVGFKIQ